MFYRAERLSNASTNRSSQSQFGGAAVKARAAPKVLSQKFDRIEIGGFGIQISRAQRRKKAHM